MSPMGVNREICVILVNYVRYSQAEGFGAGKLCQKTAGKMTEIRGRLGHFLAPQNAHKKEKKQCAKRDNFRKSCPCFLLY